MAKNKKESPFAKTVNIRNRKASFEYEFLDKYVAGIVLTGTEIKSLRMSKLNMQEAFCFFKGTELWIKQMHISPYSQGNYNNHVPDRERKLLLTKRELRKLEQKSQEKGLAIIPTRLFINDRGLAKLEIALGRGKKLHDKRESIKERDTKKELKKMNF